MIGGAPNAILTRVILQPRGGGELLESFDQEEAADVELDTVLAAYTQRFGEPIEVAYTEVPGVDGPVSLGWVFEVPPFMEVPGPREEFEMVLIPMFDDLDSHQRTSLFIRLAEQRHAFQEAFDRGEVSSLTTATLDQRQPDEAPRVDVHTQRRDEEPG